MANLKAVLVRLCKTESGWKRYPAVIGRNGRVKPGYVMVDGEQLQYPGRYQIRTYKGTRTIYKDAGEFAGDAQAALLNATHLLAAKASAALAGTKVEEVPGRDRLDRKAKEFIRDAEQRGATEAADINRLVTNQFIECTGKTWVDEINKEDIFRFHKWLRARGNSDRTVANKHARVKSFLRFAEVDVKNKKIIPPAPGYDKTLPNIYTKEQIAGILKAAGPYMHLAIGLTLKCGLREQELMHAEWSDVDVAEKVFRVSSKPHYDFHVKDSEERDIPIPDDLLRELCAWRKKHPKSNLLLATSGGKPNEKLLRTLKRLAKTAGLNCGSCEGCKGNPSECREWTLHQFRRTFCTTLLRSGLDLRTVQSYMGHADLASTMRYLRPASTAESQAMINAIQW